jgi:oxygen-independent coproporphyrinogen-3 oxidase
MNHRSTTMYLRRVLAGQSPITESESLSPEDRAREALVFGLRRIDGVEPAGFRERFGFEVDALVGTELADMIARGLIEQADERIRLTREGLMLSDSIWPYFLKK